MSVADSNGAGDAALVARANKRTPEKVRTDDLLFQDLGMAGTPSPSARNFLSEAVHALRRRWVSATLTGFVVGSVVFVAVWFGVRRQFTATAELRVSADKSNVLELGQHAGGTAGFEVYKKTQRQLLRNPAFLTSVLEQESVAGLSLVAQQNDPVAWLQDVVRVTYPDEAEIMQISVVCDDAQTAQTLANAIVNVYCKEDVYSERQEETDRITHLQNAASETEASLRKKRDELKTLAQTMGTGDSQTLTLEQMSTLETYSALSKQLTQVRFDLKRAQRARQMHGGTVPAQPDANFWVSDEEMEVAAARDVVIVGAKAQLDRLQSMIDEAKKSMFGEAEKAYVAQCQTSLERIRKRMETRKLALRKELLFSKKGQAQAAGQALATSTEELVAQQADLEVQVGNLHKEAEKFGRSSVDMELMRTDIKALDALRDRIQKELQQANIQFASFKSRVTPMGKATVLHNADQTRHLTLSGSAGGAAFFAGCALVIFWDLRRQRLNTTREISEAIRLPLLGTVPHARRVLGSNRSASQVKEAVDGIAARLVFSPSDDSRQVILVTSAVAGEGKSTVAVNLAASIAEMGRRTVLVDFDLRRPSLHNIFDVNSVPGVSDVLEGQEEPLKAVQATSVDNLFLLPAGDGSRPGLFGRDDEAVQKLLGELRAAFMHVVIDAGPVLPIVDTRVLARHADGVIVSLLRDVTEIPKVNSACELLRSFDVCILGAVMVGAPASELYYTRTIVEVPEPADHT